MIDQDGIRLDDKNIHSLKMYRSHFDSIYIKRDNKVFEKTKGFSVAGVLLFSTEVLLFEEEQ